MTLPLAAAGDSSLLAGAIESDSAYFEMAAESRPLEGAVIHRADPEAIARGGARWIAEGEAALLGVGALLSRIYLAGPHQRADELLRDSGYASRDELIFVDALPGPTIDIVLRPVVSAADWADKLRFHEQADITPDGHGNSATDWVELERRKCAAGMEAFLAELDGELVGAVGAITCDRFVRTKNLIVHPNRRRRGIAQAMLGRIAELGRRRGLSQQCVVAVRGEEGELLYRAIGMAMFGFQVEWSKPISGAAE